MLMKGIYPSGNNKMVIILFHVYDRCLSLKLDLYKLEMIIHMCLIKKIGFPSNASHLTSSLIN
jgi:hypothetical protein